MASIDSLWKQYLSSEGYSSLRDALLDQTGLTNGQVDFLWCKYLQGEGYSGSLPAMMHNWLRDKGYSGSLPLMMYRALEDGNVFGGDTPPLGCTIALTGDIGPIAGFAAADINGQAFGVTDAAANIYMASTDIVNRRPMPAPGKKVWIQVDSFSASGGFGTNSRAGYYAFDANGDPIAFVTVNGNASGAGAVGATSVSGAALANEYLPQGFVPYVSLGIDSDGELYIYRPDTSEVVALADIHPAFAGVFSGAASIILLGMCDLSGGGPASAGARFVTDQSEMLDGDHLGGEDWCGNELPEPPAPFVPATFDPEHKSASVALSFGNRRASSATNAHCGVMAVPPKTAGKWFVEYIVHSSNRPIVGFTYSQNNTGDGINPSIGEGIGLFWWSSPWRVYHYGGGSHYSEISRSGNLSTGDRVTVGYDIESKLFHAYVNGEPVEGGPWPLAFTPSTSEVWPAARLFNDDSVEIAVDPVYPIPGFQQWGD